MMIDMSGAAASSWSLSRLAMAGIVCIIAGCASMMQSTPLPKDSGNRSKTINIVGEIPQKVPDASVQIADSQYLLSARHSLAASMIIPIPFASDIITGQMDKGVSDEYADVYRGHYAEIDPYRLAIERSRNLPAFSQQDDGIKLFPYVVVQECEDDLYRLSLIFQMESGNWLGRYLYHMPTTYPIEDAKKPTPQELQTFEQELSQGVDILINLVQQATSGQLPSGKETVKFGSYHVLGYNQVVSAKTLVINDGVLLDESENHVLIRSNGNPTASVPNLGLGFGVHYLEKNLLHTYEKR